MTRPLQAALKFLGLLAAAYALLLAALWAWQERLIFLPTALPATHRFDFGPDVHETWVDVDGARLNALHLKLPAPRGVAFYLHGNAGNLDSWFTGVDFWRRAGYDLFMIDYRGYGKSSGRIESEAQLLADVRAAWKQVTPAYVGKARVIVGRSLGTGPAAVLAAEVQPELTVLISPYRSMAAVASEHYPWVPAALLRYPLRTDEVLPRITTPVLLMHGERDTIIGPHHSQALLPLARQARLVKVPGAGHNDLQAFEGYLGALRAALVEIR